MTSRTRGRSTWTAFAAAALLAFAGPERAQRLAAQQAAPVDEARAARHVDRAHLMRDVRTLSSDEYAGRRTGTAGGVKARTWIVEQFKTIGLAPAGTRDYLHPFSFTNQSSRGGVPVRTRSEGANVVGRLEGSRSGAKAIVVSAHYDHLGTGNNGIIFHGADDNASGVAVLLAAARHFAANRPRHPLLFVAFDAEEVDLSGARAFAREGSTVRDAALNVNLDMVSRSARQEIFAAGAFHTPGLRPILEDVQTRAAVTIRFGHDRPAVRRNDPEDWTALSDHAVFHQAAVPFIYFGVDYHADYHRPTDTADKIDQRFFGNCADMIVEAIRTFDARLP